MAKKHEYVIGSVHGILKIIGLERDDGGRLMVRVRCVRCGAESVRVANSIFRNRTNSCRCQSRSVGGLSCSRIYNIFHNMLDRCNNPRCASYGAYGAKGIKVCDEWNNNGFLKFYQWSMENGYSDDLTIDRIDAHMGYAPENCQWITKSENTARANHVQHRRANKGKYFGVSPENERYEFDNANQFAREHTNLKAANIRKCANGNAKTHCGWRFGFLSSENTLESQSTIESTR